MDRERADEGDKMGIAIYRGEMESRNGHRERRGKGWNGLRKRRWRGWNGHRERR